jgi:hypothetical protein
MGSIPIRGAGKRALLPTVVCKTAVAKQVGRLTRGSIPPLLSHASAGHWRAPAAVTRVRKLCRFNSCPMHCSQEHNGPFVYRIEDTCLSCRKDGFDSHTGY